MKRKMVALILTAAMTLGLTACGSSGTSTGGEDVPDSETNTTVDQTDASTDDTDSSSDSAGEAVSGAIKVVCAANAEVSEINPYISSGISVCYAGYIFQSLGYAEGRGNSMTGVLAESWEEVEPLVYEIHLYDGIVDSDGNPITSEDVVASFEWMKSSGVVSKMAYLDSIEAVDDLTVKMTLASDTLGALEAMFTKNIVATEAAEAAGGDYQKVQVGSGPYVVDTFESGSYMTLKKKTDYWKTGDLTALDNAAPDEITFQYIASSAQLAIAMENKEIDGILYFSGSDANNFIDDSGNSLDGYYVESYLNPNTYQVFCNMSGDSIVSNDLNLRQAIFTAIDPEELLDGALDNLGTVTHDYANSVYPDYNPDWDSQPYFDYDLEQAQSYLADSNYDGSTLRIVTYNFAPNTDIATILQQELAAAGINAEITPIEQAQADDMWNTTENWDLFLADTLSMDYIVNCYTYFLDVNNYATGKTKNGWYDADFQALIDTAKSSATYSQDAVDAIHNYLIDAAVCRGMVVSNQYSVWQDGIEDVVFNYNGYPTVKQFKFASDYVSNAK